MTELRIPDDVPQAAEAELSVPAPRAERVQALTVKAMNAGVVMLFGGMLAMFALQMLGFGFASSVVYSTDPMVCGGHVCPRSFVWEPDPMHFRGILGAIIALTASVLAFSAYAWRHITAQRCVLVRVDGERIVVTRHSGTTTIALAELDGVRVTNDDVELTYRNGTARAIGTGAPLPANAAPLSDDIHALPKRRLQQCASAWIDAHRAVRVPDPLGPMLAESAAASLAALRQVAATSAYRARVVSDDELTALLHDEHAPERSRSAAALVLRLRVGPEVVRDAAVRARVGEGSEEDAERAFLRLHE